MQYTQQAIKLTSNEISLPITLNSMSRNLFNTCKTFAKLRGGIENCSFNTIKKKL